MTQRQRLRVLVSALFVAFFAGARCDGITENAPAARMPVLDQVLIPGTPRTPVSANTSGEYEVLPRRSVILRFRTPYPSDVEVRVDGDVLERTDSLPRIQTLEAQDLGYYHADVTNTDWATTGEATWEAVVSAKPSKRIGPRLTVGIRNLSINPSHTGPDKTSASLDTPIVSLSTDLIRLLNNAGNDNPVVLLNARRGAGCVQHEIHRAGPLINFVDVGSVLSEGPCHSEVVVFSQGDAMEAISPGTTWTDSVRDVLQVDLPDPWQVPVTLWLVSTLPDTETRARTDVARAIQLFDTSRCGISFNPTFRNIAGDHTAANLIDPPSEATICSPAWLNALTASPFFTPGQLNVYYSDVGWSSFSGAMCPTNPNVIVIALNASNDTLAHEFGHSFTLGHTDTIPGIPNTNVMYPGGAFYTGVGRTEFTEGQCFRCNVNNASILNTNGIRTGTVRSGCPDGVTTMLCPALTLDVPN